MRVATDYLWIPALVVGGLLGFGFVGCAYGQQPGQPPVGVEALESMRLSAPADAPTPNESYLAKQMQEHLARCLSPMVWELSSGAPDGTGDVVHTPSDWRTNHQTFRWRGTVRGQPYTGAYITFTNARYDPEHSDLNYGPARLAQDVNEPSPGKTKLIKNDSDAPVEVTYTEGESLTNSDTMTVTHGLEMDLSVDSTQTISGGYAGVDASVSMQEHFGVAKTQEESREQAREGTHEASIDIDFTAAPGEYYLVTISKEHAVTYQDFRIDGVMDFDIEIGFGHEGGGRQRAAGRAGRCTCRASTGCASSSTGTTRGIRRWRLHGPGVLADEERHRVRDRPAAPAHHGRRDEPKQDREERDLRRGVARSQRAGPPEASAGRRRERRGAVIVAALAGVAAALSVALWACQALDWLARRLDHDDVQYAKREAGEGWFYGPE